MTEKEKQQSGELFDPKDRELTADRITARKLGDEYSVEAKKIESYILHTNPFNRKGNFDVSEQNVDFVYEKYLPSDRK